MRTFVISDIHGNGNFYHSVISYLESISEQEEVTLYINGDLIDRGEDSVEVLLDVISRIKKNNHSLKIEYLGGNHELLMYEVFDKRRRGLFVPNNNDWYYNGGQVTDIGLEKTLQEKEKILEVVDFIGDLKLYAKLPQKINGKNVLLVHASAPNTVDNHCEISIKDYNSKYDIFIWSLVWTRKDDPTIPFRCRIGNNDYFTIIGHTPNDHPCGYVYHQDENYLNIDGGCAKYAVGLVECDHFPLVEVKDGYLKILTFNNNQEILYGNYFINGESIPYSIEELDEERSFFMKKMIKK